MNETLKAIKSRRTTRKFKSEQISDENLQAIVEAGLYAPSAHNQQSWHFTVIQNQEMIKELNIATKNACKKSPDASIQKMMSNEDLNLFYGAPTLIVVSGETEALMPQIDCAAATQNMFIAAESLEIGGCWNGFIRYMFAGENGAKYKKKLNIPEDHTPYYAAVFGNIEARGSNASARKENTVSYIL